jgi:hypothetical protein
MSIPGAGNPLLLGGAGGYKIERSLRFNSADSAYLSRTPASAGNRKTWTWSGWIKRSAISATTILFSVGLNTDGDTGRLLLYFGSDNKLAVDGGAVSFRTTTAVYRDPSAWYHVLISVDTTLAAANSRIRLYINGSEITTFDVLNNPSQNADTGVNRTSAHNIGRRVDPGDNYANYYLAEVHFIDGQALTPSSFGEFSATTGVWIPKRYAGTYGTNGFHLDFSNNASAAALGTDSSGNGNTWTVNNISVAAGAGNDSLVDVPTNGSEVDTGSGGQVRGNYCTLNPLANGGNTLSNGNLQAVGAVDKTTLATIGMSSGKWYCEVTVDNVGGSCLVGIAKGGVVLSTWIGSSPEGWAYGMNGLKYTNNNGGISYGNTYTTGDVIGIAFDADAGSLYFYKNGTVQNSGTAAFTGLTSGPYFFAFGSNAPSFTWNFGQRPFAYTAPSGFKALCTQNLPTPTITKPSTVMDVKLYTGNGGTQTISGLGFSPDFVWIKNRQDNLSWNLFNDTVRGANKILASNETGAEYSNDTNGYLSAFTSDGFTLTNGGNGIQVNGSGKSFVSWAWDAGSSTVTNTSGTISSQVRANPSAGFSVVTWTGNGASATVGHGLGVAPSFLIVKSRSTSNSWVIYHRALGGAFYLLFDTSAAGGSANATWGSANSDPTASVFSVGSGAATNGNGSNFVAYCFAPVAGYSAFGSYTGNGSADGPFVYLGFRPALVIVKMSSSTGDWTMLDYQREGYNVDNDPLYPNRSNVEGTTDLIDITSNGFKVRTTDATFNTNAGTYVYAAFSEVAFNFARAR